MAGRHRFLCWNLRTACFIGFIMTIICVVFALTLRLADLIAQGTDFEISQGFHTLWRAHFWQAFLASDIVLIILHVALVLFSVFMVIQYSQRHFVMYIGWHTKYMFFLIIYTLVEFIFSVFEYSYYGMNTFRLAFVVFTWLFWLARTFMNTMFAFVLYWRKVEMGEQMEMELRFAGEKKRSERYEYR